MSDNLKCNACRKFIVYKIEDIKKYLSDKQRSALTEISIALSKGRKKENKVPVNEYIVINTDEPYIDEVIEILKRNGHWG